MNYAGDFPTSHTAVCLPFDSFAASTGAPSAVTNFAAADIVIFKDGGTTQRTSANGITVTTSFDTNTGLQMVVIDLSDNTDAGFYAAGHEYQVAVADITIDGQTVRFWLGCFSIERAGGALAVLKDATVGLSAIETLVDELESRLTAARAGYLDNLNVGGAVASAASATAIETDTQDIQSRLPAALTANGNIKASLLEIISTALSEGAAGRLAAAWQGMFNIAVPVFTTASVNQSGDAYGIVNSGVHGNAALKTLIDAVDDFVDTEVASILAAVDTEVAAILADTNELQTDWVNGGRLDLLIDAIKAKTDSLTFTVAGIVDSNPLRVNGSQAAAVNLALASANMLPGTVDTTGFASTTTEFESDDITEATADHFNGRIIVFTSGALQYQATTISDYALSAARGHFTVVALTEAPANNGTFLII